MIGLGFESPPLVNTVCTERTDWCTIEHWITLVCLYIGSIFYALLISSVSFVMANLDKGGSNLSQIIWTINEYLKNKKIPVPIKDKVRSFFRIQFSEGKWYDDDEILGVLPPNLRSEIISFNQRQLLLQVPLLTYEQENNSSFPARLAPLLSTRLVFSGENVFEEDTTGMEMFFVVSGIVQIFSKHSESAVKAIADGCYFGDVACLLGCKRTASTQARTNSALSVLQKKDLVKLLSDYPDVLHYMLGIAKKRKLRLDCLDTSNNIPALSDDQLEDEEDAGTLYFVNVGRRNDLAPPEPRHHLNESHLTPGKKSSQEPPEFIDGDLGFSPLRGPASDDASPHLAASGSSNSPPPSPRYYVKQDSGLLFPEGGDTVTPKEVAPTPQPSPKGLRRRGGRSPHREEKVGDTDEGQQQQEAKRVSPVRVSRRPPSSLSKKNEPHPVRSLSTKESLSASRGRVPSSIALDEFLGEPAETTIGPPAGNVELASLAVASVSDHEGGLGESSQEGGTII